MHETNNTNQPNNASSKYVFITSPTGGKAYFNKGIFVVVPLFLSFLFFIFVMLIPDGSSGDFYALLVFKAFFLLFTIFSFHHYFHVIHEVRIDEENLSIRKFKTFKIDKWEHIKYVRAYSSSTNGFTCIWIKRKKDAPKLSTRYFNIFIFPSTKYETDLLSKMFLRIKTYTELKYNKNI